MISPLKIIFFANTDMPSTIIAAWVGNIGGTLHGRIENVHISGGLVSNSSTGQVGGIGARAGSAEIINCSFTGLAIDNCGSAMNVSSSAGWSSEIWNLDGSVPVLR